MTARPFDRFDGVLFFPVTPFDEHDRVDVAALEEHVADRVTQGAGDARRNTSAAHLGVGRRGGRVRRAWSGSSTRIWPRDRDPAFQP